jgi:curved DNA-binding protein CbpA
MAGFDPYQILGIERTAPLEIIKRQYRTLAKLYHPDHNPGDDAKAEKFRDVQLAYETLADPLRRMKYDQFGIIDGEKSSQEKVAALRQIKVLFLDMLSKLEPEQVEGMDFLGMMAASVARHRSKLEMELGAAQFNLHKKDKLRLIFEKRLTQHGNALVPNVFMESILDEVKAAQNMVQAIKEKIKLGTDMLEILKDFEFDFEQMQFVQFHVNVGTAFTSTNTGG